MELTQPWALTRLELSVAAQLEKMMSSGAEASLSSAGLDPPLVFFTFASLFLRRSSAKTNQVHLILAVPLVLHPPIRRPCPASTPNPPPPHPLEPPDPGSLYIFFSFGPDPRAPTAPRPNTNAALARTQMGRDVGYWEIPGCCFFLFANPWFGPWLLD